MTIRGIDPQLAEKLAKTAKEQGTSANQFILDIIRTHLGLRKKKRHTAEYHDLDNLFGKWREDEFRKIQGKIDEERRVDQELWR